MTSYGNLTGGLLPPRTPPTSSGRAFVVDRKNFGWKFFGWKTADFEFSHKYNYWCTLEDTYEIILGSFQTNVMTKFVLFIKKTFKNLDFGPKWPFLSVFAQEIAEFEFINTEKQSKTHFFEADCDCSSKNVVLFWKLSLNCPISPLN